MVCAGKAVLSMGKLCESLLQVWHQHMRSTRLATPLLQTVDCLMQRGALRVSVLQPGQAQALLDKVRAEGRNSSDLPRLCAVVSVLCHFAAEGPVNTQKVALQVGPLRLQVSCDSARSKRPTQTCWNK
jgi:Tubulin folding cofactor D C terminal